MYFINIHEISYFYEFKDCGIQRDFKPIGHKGMFENKPFIKNRKIFLELPFDRKGGGSKIFEKDSPKTFIISRFYRTYLFKQSPSVSVGVKRL